MAGCSAQYAEYSTREVEDRMKGGAVREKRSPLKEAIDYKSSSVTKLLDAMYTAKAGWAEGGSHLQE